MTFPKLPAHFGVDPFLISLIATVVLASVLPARGLAAGIAGYAVTGAVALLFFLYGVKLSYHDVLEGFLNWRLQTVVLISTFILFPVLGLSMVTVLRPWITGLPP
jgi:sodium/bile acid cotransporter 7